tara:strand:+ start:4970 stop:6109 length:1140 start_codon:yes stop_codon:yes gene_type:complete
MANLSDVKNTPRRLRLSALAIGTAQAFANFAEAGHKLNVDRRSADGGKLIGRVQVGEAAADTFSMMIATGKDPEALWSNTNGADITPAYTVTYPAPTVGVGSDLKPIFNNGTAGIASVPFPIVPEAELVDLGSTVNYFEYSGKKKGTVVLVYVGIVLTYAIASGRLPADTWRLADGTIITPVGTLRTATSTENSDYKPTMANTEWINSIDFPVFYAGDIASLDYNALYNDEQKVSSHDNRQVLAISGGLLHLLHGNRDTGVLTWHDLGGILADVTVAASSPAGSIITAAGDTNDPAVARVLTYNPSGTDVVLDITGNVSGLQQLAFTTTVDLTVAEMAIEIAAQAQVFTDAIITSLGEDVLILAGGTDASLTIDVFTLT